MLLLFTVLFGFAGVVTPILAGLAWLRWSRSPRRRSRRTRLSLASLSVASVALLLGIVTLALSIHSGFLTIAPSLRHTYEAGLLSSLVALGLGLAGLRHSSPLRWQAPTISLGALLLWFLAGSGN